MKKSIFKSIIYTFGIIIIILSCDSQNKETEKEIPTQYDIVKKNIESSIKTKLHDPKNYEFLEIKLIDSVLYSDNIEYRKQSFIESRDITYPIIYKGTELIDKIQECNEILLKIDSIELNLGKKVNIVASYTYLFSFRGTNSSGAKVLNEYIIQTDPAPQYKIINMTVDKNKVLINPNDFPGYQELISRQ